MTHVLRYLCPFCRRGRSSGRAAAAHIARCYKNPAARACKTCSAYQPREPGDYATNYPGCAEGCDAGRELLGGIQVGCADWVSLASLGNRKDGSSPNNSPSPTPEADQP